MPTPRNQWADPTQWHHTTVLAVRRGNETAIGADGQVTLGNTVMKGGAQKIRPLYSDRVLVGFAGSSADAFALLTRLEAKLEEFRGNLGRAAVELARDWRLDRNLRQLEALMLATDGPNLVLLSGTGDLFEPDGDVIAVGSGGPMAQAAAVALTENTDLEPEDVVRKALIIAGDICIYTNHHLTIRTARQDGDTGGATKETSANE